MKSWRGWFYLVGLVLVVGLLIFWVVTTHQINNAVRASEVKNQQASQRTMATFLAKQQNAPKLLGLAKRVNRSQPELVELIVDRAYELAPTNSDVVLLASYFHPELKERALELNPLAETK